MLRYLAILTLSTTCSFLSVAFAAGPSFNAYAPYQDRGSYLAAMDSMYAIEQQMSEHSRRLEQLADDFKSAYAYFFYTATKRLVAAPFSGEWLASASARELLSIQTEMRDRDDFKYVARLRALHFGALKNDCLELPRFRGQVSAWVSSGFWGCDGVLRGR